MVLHFSFNSNVGYINLSGLVILYWLLRHFKGYINKVKQYNKMSFGSSLVFPFLTSMQLTLNHVRLNSGICKVCDSNTNLVSQSFNQ